MEETFNFSEKASPFETTTDKYESIQTKLNSITDGISLILCSCAIVADVVLIVSILSFAKLRCRPNYYVMHFAIFNCLFFVATPPFFILFEQTAFSLYYSSTFLCTLLQTERTCLSFCFLFTLGLCFEWLASSLNVILGFEIYKVLNYLPYVLYLIGMPAFFVSIGLCFTEYSGILSALPDSIFFITFVICIALNFIDYKYCCSNRNNFSAVLCNVIIFSWLPYHIHKSLYKLIVRISNDDLMKWMMEAVKFLFVWPAYASALGVLFVICSETELVREILQVNICRKPRMYEETNQVQVEEDDSVTGDELEEKYGNNHLNGNFFSNIYV